MAAFLAPLVESLGIGGEAAGAAADGTGLLGASGMLGQIGGFMGDHPFLMGNLMGRAMSGGGPAGMAQMGPSAGASVAEPMVGVTGKVATDSLGEENSVGLATQNRGENSDPDEASSTGIAGEAEHGDSPEQLKDVDLGTTQTNNPADPFPADDLKNQGGANGDLRNTATNAFHSNLPLILEFAFSDQSGSDHPVLKALDELLESAFPGYKDVDPMLEEMDGGEDTTETGVEPGDPENPTEKLEKDLGQDLDEDGPADTPEDDKKEKTEREAHRIAREAGYCPECWGALDRLGTCQECGKTHDLSLPDVPANGMYYTPLDRQSEPPGSGHWKNEPFPFPTPLQDKLSSHKQADVPGPPSSSAMGYATDTNAMTNITGVPTCPLCGQNHVAGTPCPTPQMQAPAATNPISPAATNFGVPMQNNKVVTKYKVVTAEYDDDEIDREPDPMHNESYEDGETPDVGWYEDWQGPEQEKHPWVDDAGKPLEEGREYEMHSTGYAIPDKIKVLAVTPNKLTYELEAGDIAYKDTITTDDVYKQGYTFQPAKPNDDPGMETQPKRQPLELEHPMPPRPGDDALPQVDDLTTPQTKVSDAYWMPPQLAGPEQGKLPDEEDGYRAPVRRPNMGTGHGGPSQEEDDTAGGEQNPPYYGAVKMASDTCDECGFSHSDDGYDWECPNCGNWNERAYDRNGEPHEHVEGWDTNITPDEDDRLRDEGYYGSFRGDNPNSRNWLNDPGPGQGVDIDPVTMAKVAGKDFSPREQRQFIDEQGTARNLHRLNLEGTHYELDDYGDSLW